MIPATKIFAAPHGHPLIIASALLLCLFVSSFGAPPSNFFVANEGQWDEPFAFKLSAGNTTYYITESGLTIDIRQYDRSAAQPCASGLPPHPVGGLRGEEAPPERVRGHVLKISFVNPNSLSSRPSPHSDGGNQRGAPCGLDKLPSYSNYFLGRDSCKWRSRVGHYQKVIAKNVWQGIDVEFVAVGAASATGPGLKTNYIVHPYADPSQIVIEYEGLDAPLRVDGGGNLVLNTSFGELKEQKPWAFQQLNFVQKDVATSFQMLSESTYSFTTISYDINKKITIDPLIYGSYFGGYGPDTGRNIQIGSDGFVYVGGTTIADTFPTTPGAYEETNPHSDNNTGFVSKFTPNGDSLAYSTYVGANVTPRGSTTNQEFLRIDNQGRAWGGGETASLDWPVTPNAFDTTYNDLYYEGYFYRLSEDGSVLEYCSYLGGSGSDAITCAVFDHRDQALWLCGEVGLSPDFPVTEDALYHEAPGISNVFLGRFNTVTLEMEYLTYFGGDTYDFPRKILVGGSDSVWIVGQTESVEFPVTLNAFHTTVTMREGFASLLNLHDNRVEYSTLIGGANRDDVNAIAILDQDRVVLAGKTRSGDFPVTPGAADSTYHNGGDNAFITIFSSSGGLEHSTLLSGLTWSDLATGVAISSNYLTVVGETSNSDFPVTEDAEDSILNDINNPGWSDLFLARLNFELTDLEYSTFLGGNHVDHLRDVHFVNADTFWVTGETGSSDFPCTANAYRSEGGELGDAFIAGYAMPPFNSVPERPQIVVPRSLDLQIFPNPFNGSTSLLIDLRVAGHARVRVFDILGRQVALNDLGFLPAGTHHPILTLNSASGLYTIRLETPSESTTRKTVLIR